MTLVTTSVDWQRLAIAIIASVFAAAGTEPALASDRFSDHPTGIWVKQSPRDGVPAPPLQYEGSGALDPRTGRWIHFGGHDGIPQGFYLFTCDLESGAWRQHFPNTSPPGVCCVDGSNTFDVASERFVAFPGGSLGHGYQWSRSVKLKQSNVWLYDPSKNSWTDMRPPPYRRPEKYSREIIGSLNSSATYDPVHEVTVTFGGQGAGGSTNALFVYDAYSNQLEQRHASNAPPERDGSGLCYDSWRDLLVMFGSQYSDDERTWTYRFDENRWEAHELDPHPPGRKEGTYSTNPKMAFDSKNGVCLCVVRRGEESGQPAGSLETWALDLASMNWKHLETGVAPDPSASRARNLSYWPEADLFVLESVAADKSGPQIWTFRYRGEAVATTPAPPVDLRAVTQAGAALLDWKPGNGSPPRQYRVYRAGADRPWNAKFDRVADVTETEYRDEGLDSRVYVYRVTALGDESEESQPSRTTRTQPRVLSAPTVSVLSASRVELEWTPNPEADVAGYNIYRGVASVDTVRRGAPKAWSDNDPEYPEPVVVGVRDITEIERLNAEALVTTSYTDASVHLDRPGEPSGDYRYAVYAYIVRAVNRLGVESGPSPYALTIPSTPEHVLLRKRESGAEIRWAANPESAIAGYRLYRLGKSHWEIVRVNEEPITATTFLGTGLEGSTRFWVVAVDRLGQEGQPSSAVWYRHDYRDFYDGDWHQ